MQKIMFNDKYGLTKAVLEGRKTMTRRAVPKKLIRAIEGGAPGFAVMESKYKVGEVVAVAQSYKDAGFSPDTLIREYKTMKDVPGWTNKMFVEAQSMLYFIRITNVRVERMQDISDEDCMKEGIFWDYGDYPYMATKMYKYNDKDEYIHPKSAFAGLIDKVSGKGTWASNPWVFVYEFELVK